MITFNHLQKVYESTQALKDLSLTIPNGKIFGFLGHNGAGKSTTLKSLVSIIEPTSGSIAVDGYELAEHRLDIKRRIGYVPDSPDMFLELTANDYWDLIASAYQIPKEKRERRQAELAQLFDMTAHADSPIGDFSHGMRQKTIVIGALLPDPDIWVLDEPMTGLDPQAIYDLKQLMRSHAAKGKTVIFSTHVLATAQELCDELAILRHGELIYTGSVKQLLSTMPDASLETIYLKMAGRQADQATVNDLEGGTGNV
ncbi:ABC transporter ATP-binding protein [Lentilactobacillus parafarraginis]|jgi:ABC-2 type transport system ATP-binding protein|uniref:ABC transporter, ATP-binding protein EcsA n=3 Tax=Lentilactobacillus parafarraginis TaxID=390842 RepID=A0A0R1YKM2_9LACO|nr:ABC transporter ATP-binding protein [Lentilactobacillus parafarraginis]EHL97066.1 putative ABC transporter, ATP-binding protein EcsA [Lentilactobacillus parafarraginis F0439]KRM42421.1 ABC transporter, ATP-binding protein EcsA [Lentilactobacillus parafarraginis DSM 18390 = JCM 14109]TLQ17926.1 ABC transporter ATP-binding protein [Lentilactobacillus parafarraginis]